MDRSKKIEPVHWKDTMSVGFAVQDSGFDDEVKTHNVPFNVRVFISTESEPFSFFIS